MMSPAFSPICQTISSLSIATNLYLLYVYFRCPLRAIKSYKYFFLLTAIQDIVYSSCIILAVPVIIADNYTIIFVATGPIYSQPLGQVFVIGFITVFITSVLLIADSFLYRYLQVCKHHLFEHILAPQNILVIVLVNVAIFANWIAFMCIVCWPNKAVVERISQITHATTGLNPFECAYIGLSIKTNFTAINLALLIETVLFLFLTVGAVICSAWKIHETLRKATFSKSLRNLHSQMFTLLLLQSACPFTFLHGPSVFAYILLFFGLSTSNAVVYTITILLSLFPLFAPIIIIAFLKDYRNHTLSTLRLSQRVSGTTSIFISEMKTNF